MCNHLSNYIYYLWYLLQRPSLAKRRISLRRSSLIQATREQQEVPWDLFDRLLLPIICCQATAIILSGTLNLLRISQVSAFALFLWFVVITIGAVLFYHHLKVRKINQNNSHVTLHL